jgi:hypothetical protein
MLQQIDDELTNLRTMDLRETEGILSRGEDRIKAVLKPDQQEKLRQTFELRRERVRDWLGVNDEQKTAD